MRAETIRSGFLVINKFGTKTEEKTDLQATKIFLVDR